MVQKFWQIIPVKILDHSDKRAFSYKFYRSYLFIYLFIFYRIFHLFLGPLNILSTSLRAKMETSHSGRNSWPLRTGYIFVGPLNMPSTIFRAKMAKLHFSRNSWPVGTRGIFVQNLPQFYFFLSNVFSIFFLCPQNRLSACFGAKMPTLYSGLNSWLVWQNGIFLQILPDLFFYSFLFFFYKIFPLFLRPLNTLSNSFHAKIVTLHSGWNSWPVRTRAIWYKFFTNFFFFRKNFPFFSWTNKYAIYKFWCKNEKNVFQSKYLTSRTKGHFPTNFTRFIFVFFFIFSL